MPPKQKKQKSNTSTPSKSGASAKPETHRSPAPANVPIDAQQQERPAPPAAAVERPKASFISAYFFAASFVVRSVLMPLYGAMSVSGMVSRWSYPSQYTAPGVSCQVEALDGPKFCEHEIIFEHEGVALLSCDSGRANWNTVMGPLLNPDPKGQLWLYDYAGSKTSTPVDLEGFPVQYDFHPLGITTFTDALKTSLFVVNHQRTGPSIEVFTLSLTQGKAKVSYERSILAAPLIKSANGIVAMDHAHLYVTNDHAWTRLEAGAPWAILETFSGNLKGQAWITHIDLSAEDPVMRKVYQGMAFANGLAKGSDNIIYAASSVAGTVSVLHIENATSPVLGYRGNIEFGYSVDNVHVIPGTPSDKILVGGHPSFSSLTKLAADPDSASTASPSWISIAQRKTAEEIASKQKPVKIEKQTWHESPVNKDWHVQTIYEDDGHHFSSSTGAGLDVARDNLISPGLYESGVLVCRGASKLLR